ncbi:MAG TPA: NUDIX hydrolase [Acetivibrio sp.]|uniref:NUDIX hydrolase n=1 Tax=Acetivibrio sp. TaxID=1872092 RepID=UPI002C3DA6B0|nr:NUDIX hydrolase [Acetivibrio sp.]HOM02532.1 NUDIX hydrolase [Acetivibrio sp.]
MNYEEKTVSKKRVYDGNIISVESVNVLLPNGKEASRDVVLHPGASVVIPISDNNDVYMVRQFRKPVEKELLELPAGKLDKGEDPEVCARRELKEETGLEADKIKHILSYYSAPGFTNEILHVYAAVGLHEGEACADEDEFISSKKVPINKLVEMVLNNEINDAKTIIGILLAEKIVKGEIKL